MEGLEGVMIEIFHSRGTHWRCLHGYAILVGKEAFQIVAEAVLPQYGASCRETCGRDYSHLSPHITPPNVWIARVFVENGALFGLAGPTSVQWETPNIFNKNGLLVASVRPGGGGPPISGPPLAVGFSNRY